LSHKEWSGLGLLLSKREVELGCWCGLRQVRLQEGWLLLLEWLGVEVVKQTVAMVVERVGRVPGNEATAVDVARSAGAVMVLAAKAAMLVVEVTS
jgi:hypothetical protein